ncbi:porin [Candidatus Methylomirabilis sp.]|uniref:porin n=1 Tax=Candidatus Methylomirabilis sp. TaxID=2032687 RepID=UPI002A624AEF|nr:porin [Candidatus Methylomirabilis sp.]
MTQRGWWVRGAVLGSALLLAPVGAWADKLTELEQAFETQRQSLQQLQQEMNRLRQDRTAQQAETDRRVMEVEKKAAEAAASSLLTGYEPGKGFFLKSADGQFTLNLRGYVQTWFITEGARQEEEFNAADKAAGIARHTPSTFRQRRTRLIVSGQVFNDFGFYIEPELSFGGVPDSTGQSTGAARLEAGYVNYTYAPWAKVTVGQYKPRFGLEMITASTDLDFAERAVISKALSPDWQLGATVEGTVKLLPIPVYYGVGIYNGCGRIDQCKGGIDNDGDKEFTGRVTVAPPMPFGNLTIGLNADHRTFRVVNGKGATDANSTTTSVSGTSFHRFNPAQATGWKLGGDGAGTSQNGFLINGNRVTGGGDLVFDLYPFIIKGEYAYASQERDALGAGGSNLDNLIIQGGYGSLGYWLFGNKRSGLLAIGRYEHLRVDDNSGAFTAPASATKERPMEMRSGTLGLNWYVNPSVRLRANYLLTDVRPGRNTIGVSNSTHGELVHEGIAEVQVQF